MIIFMSRCNSHHLSSPAERSEGKGIQTLLPVRASEFLEPLPSACGFAGGDGQEARP